MNGNTEGDPRVNPSSQNTELAPIAEASDSAPLSIGDPYTGSRDLTGLASLLVALVCLAMVATYVWATLSSRSEQIARTEIANTNLARAVTNHIEGAISEVDHILAVVVFELEQRGYAAESLDRLQPVFVNHVANVQALRGLFVYDATGRWLIHSEPTSDPARNNADREYFKLHQANMSQRPRIGAPIISRSSGEWVIPVSRRVDDQDGNFSGVALATLSIQHLRSLLDRYEVGHEGAIAVGLPDQILFRKPFNTENIGRPTRPSPLHSVFRSKLSGTVVSPSSIDGVERLISFETMRNYPIRITVAVSQREALQEWRKASYVQGAWTMLLCGFVGFGGRYVIRAMRLRIAAETGLRQTRDELTVANEKLSNLAQFDSLTGLANRRYFDTRLSRLFSRAQRERRSLAVVLIDVDQFKNYNDLYGHVQGDECLRQVASAVQSAARRPADVVARYGGEELVMLLPGADVENATALAEAARAAVLDLQITHAATVLGQVSISLGVAAWIPGPDEAPYELVRAADSALYRAKRDGRNQVAESR